MKETDFKSKKIVRTSAGLRDALFDVIESVRNGEVDATQAKAVAFLAKEICSTVHLEIEVAKLRTEYPADIKLTLPGTLRLGEPESVDETPKLRKV